VAVVAARVALAVSAAPLDDVAAPSAVAVALAVPAAGFAAGTADYFVVAVAAVAAAF
jgi:hypothetical protein